MARPMCSAIGLGALSVLLLAGCANSHNSYDNGDDDNGNYGANQYRPVPYGYRYYQPGTCANTAALSSV